MTSTPDSTSLWKPAKARTRRASQASAYGVGVTFSRLATLCFGFACAVGLVGAFVGLNVSSFWADELFTTWVVAKGLDFHQMLARAVTDVHPPVYYAIVFGLTKMFGLSETVLRAFSAVCGVASILLFIVGLRRHVSLNGRLFAAALATGSEFWFDQVQNARSYALTLVVGTAVVILALNLLSAQASGKRPSLAASAGLIALMLFGVFIHFYLLYAALAVLMVLWVYLPGRRWTMALGLLILLAAALLYLHFIVHAYMQLNTGSNWIPNTFDWYANQIRQAVDNFASWKGFLAIGLAAFGALLAVRTRNSRQTPTPNAAAPAPTPFALVLRLSQGIDPKAALCLGVPVIVLVGGMVSSVIISPNFTYRNILLCAPFLWCACALVYDAGIQKGPTRYAKAATVILCGLALVMATVVAGRTVPRNEPYREAATWLKSLPACRGQVIPVIDPDMRAWARPGYLETVIGSESAHYLEPDARVQTIFFKDAVAGEAPAALKGDIKARLAGQGCPVIAWWTHLATRDAVVAAARGLTAGAGAPDAMARLRIKTFKTYLFGAQRRLLGPTSFIVYLDPGAAGASAPSGLGGQSPDPTAPDGVAMCETRPHEPLRRRYSRAHTKRFLSAAFMDPRRGDVD